MKKNPQLAASKTRGLVSKQSATRKRPRTETDSQVAKESQSNSDTLKPRMPKTIVAGTKKVLPSKVTQPKATDPPVVEKRKPVEVAPAPSPAAVAAQEEPIAPLEANDGSAGTSALPLQEPVNRPTDGSAKPDKFAGQILIKGGRELSKKLWMTDPIYRIVRALPRSDVVHFSQCKLKEKDCVRAVQYIEEAADALDEQQARGLGGIKELRLQWAAAMHGGLQHALPLLFSHRYTLRKVDLSRNAITAKDIDSLANALDLGCAHNAHPNLELLDLSYNPNLGNDGAIAILTAIAPNKVIKALQLVHCGITDDACSMILTLLLCRPEPVLLDPSTAERTFGGAVSVAEANKFFLNLNSNRIGSRGLVALTTRARLPSYISLSVVKQVILPVSKSKGSMALPSALLVPFNSQDEEEEADGEEEEGIGAAE